VDEENAWKVGFLSKAIINDIRELVELMGSDEPKWEKIITAEEAGEIAHHVQTALVIAKGSKIRHHALI
jgi:hypothetical protein